MSQLVQSLNKPSTAVPAAFVLTSRKEQEVFDKAAAGINAALAELLAKVVELYSEKLKPVPYKKLKDADIVSETSAFNFSIQDLIDGNFVTESSGKCIPSSHAISLALSDDRVRRFYHRQIPDIAVTVNNRGIIRDFNGLMIACILNRLEKKSSFSLASVAAELGVPAAILRSHLKKYAEAGQLKVASRDGEDFILTQGAKFRELEKLKLPKPVKEEVVRKTSSPAISKEEILEALSVLAAQDGLYPEGATYRQIEDYMKERGAPNYTQIQNALKRLLADEKVTKITTTARTTSKYAKNSKAAVLWKVAAAG